MSLNGYLKDAKSRGYTERYKGTGGLDSCEVRIVRFHPKSTFRPKLNPDVFKVGQGILAWSNQTLLMYCNIFRLLTVLIVKVEKPNVVTDLYWTKQEFINYLNKQKIRCHRQGDD